MPLPAGGGKTTWPPADVKPYLDQAQRAAAWWTGDREQLTATSGGQGDSAARRRFWQRRAQGQDKTKATATLHAPLAADIAALSSDLLFGDEIKVTHPDTVVQKKLNELEALLGLHNVLAEGAEIAAATGGVYLRPVWDTTIATHPISRVHDQRRAVPDFRLGQLVAVTLWEELAGESKETVFRHLERYEPGVILHGLYQGTATELGSKVALSGHPATADLLDEVRLPAGMESMLAVDYVPNLLPNRDGSKPIGRPDVAGCDDFLDALDETWTSLMRDIRLGQARVIVPLQWLEATGAAPGRAKQLDVDDEALVGLNIEDTSAAVLKPETIQPDLRVEAHTATAVALIERIVSAAGYSPQTFGLHIDGTAQSGTALRIRQGKTDKTTAKKQRYWQPAILSHYAKLMLIWASIGDGVGLGDQPLMLEWPELQRDPKELAETISVLRSAKAMSVEAAVKAAQPELEGDALKTEVASVQGENAIAAPDFTG